MPSRDFVHRPTGCIAEMPIGSAGNLLEPGHQFEWLFLAQSSRHPAFETAGLSAALTQAFDFVQRFGVDPATGIMFPGVSTFNPPRPTPEI